MVTMGIEIKNGIITLSLTCDEVAILAKACELAQSNVYKDEQQLDIVAFRAYAMAFKAATIASTGQMNMITGDSEKAEVFAEQLLNC